METNGLANHETLELHEMLNFKTTCVIKSKMMSGVVFDQELKALMEKDVQQSIQALEYLQNFYKMPNPAVEVNYND
ncbi:spore coat protein [Niallia taxi]|uniref:spore coat protein n=1 Tax=Niallia taxi TaxID=2499688 RepID=UPI0011A61702|nr:spore coat protein [Niallia taxi]MCT2346148.1 spore coat protein [Niallia taxi]MDE5054552.1 spore coat protein [Niallia taxi]MED3965203.1 spore coat protein [Niallia taxi]WOD65937.1 spore coat protein [Niallia taxi]